MACGNLDDLTSAWDVVDGTGNLSGLNGLFVLSWSDATFEGPAKGMFGLLT